MDKGWMGMRASDDDRVEVAGQLREAAAEGRLTMDELSERIGEAMASRTYSELHRCLRELPNYESYRPWQKLHRSDAQVVRHKRRGFGLGIVVPLVVGIFGLIVLTWLSGAVGSLMFFPALIIVPIRIMLDIFLVVILFRVLRFFLHLRS